MLKRILHIVLVLLLAVATTGFTIDKHYCGNQLLSVSIFKADKCSCGGPCKDCHTNVKQVKVSDNYCVPEVIHLQEPISSDLLFVYNNAFFNLTYSAEVTDFFMLKEPPPGGPELFVLYQSFLC